MQALQAGGRPLAPSVHATGMLDSGTTITAVAPRVLAQLKAIPDPRVQTQTAAGNVGVLVYRISFTIYSLAPGTMSLFRPDWTVTNLPEDPDDVDILFGIDLLHEIILTVDGPGQSFTLDF